jgi:ribosome maturation factor RimP
MAQRHRGAPAPARSAGDQRRAGAAPRADADRSRPALDPARLREIVEPVLTEAGYDLEELRVARAGSRSVVRVVIDGDGGLDLDGVAEVSRGISAALDGAEAGGASFGTGAYTLEVSSPGVDRPLTQPRHWRRNVGRLVTATIGGAQVTGRIMAVTATAVSLDVAGARREVSLDELGTGRIQLEFGRVAELTDDEIGPEIDYSADGDDYSDGDEDSNDAEADGDDGDGEAQEDDEGEDGA